MTNELNETVEEQPKKRRTEEIDNDEQQKRFIRIRLIPI